MQGLGEITPIETKYWFNNPCFLPCTLVHFRGLLLLSGTDTHSLLLCFTRVLPGNKSYSFVSKTEKTMETNLKLF